jgi:replicative DNA helicase
MEEKILNGMIVSDTFCRDVVKLISKDTFAVPYVARAGKWCIDFYRKYKRAPGATITDIYNAEKDKIEADEARALAIMLGKLSDENLEESFNEEYLKDRALAYFKKRNIKAAAEKALSLAELDRVDEAEATLTNYQKTALATAGWVNFFDKGVAREYFANLASEKDVIFTLPGDLGKFIGPLRRNTLVGVLAPSKRGKTFWLFELALQAALNGKRAVFISLEMNIERVLGRGYKRITSFSQTTKPYLIPCFDCLRNQDNSCKNTKRLNKIRLLDSENKKPVFSQDLEYRACTLCRGTRDFVPATWMYLEVREKDKTQKVLDSINAIGMQFGKNLRICSYPAFSANISKIRQDLDLLDSAENFVPDFIAIDYADILAPEDSRITGRDRIDETWKTLKRMADEIHCNVASASQSNRQSFDKKSIVQTDISEDIRKIANSDLFLAINQTPQEKRENTVRISKIAARDEMFDQYENAIVLQQLELGQVLLDSCLERGATPYATLEDVMEVSKPTRKRSIEF